MTVARPLALVSLWLGVGWIGVFAVAVASVMPVPEVRVELNDKLVHALVYGVLMFWFVQLYRDRRPRSVVALGLLALGIALECLQGVVGYRSLELADMLANGTGIAAGWLLGETPLSRVLARVDDALSRARSG